MPMTLERQESVAAGIGAFLAPILLAALPGNALIWLDANFLEYDPDHPVPWQVYLILPVFAALCGAYAGRRAFLEARSEEWYRKESRRQRGF